VLPKARRHGRRPDKALKTTASQAAFVQRLRRGQRGRKQRHPGQLHAGPGRPRDRLGQARDQERRRQPSYNLFGIKAGKGWTGKVAEVTTTEYMNGEARKTTAKFRAYDSYESFRTTRA
jgi:flagellar protein FlgJ